MFGDLVAMFIRYGLLAFLDDVVHEFLYPAAFETDDVVVVPAVIQLEDSAAAFEIVPLHKTSGLELGQHPVYGCQTDVLAGIEQRPIHLLGGHVKFLVAFQDTEDLNPRDGHFEAGFPEVRGFHVA